MAGEVGRFPARIRSSFAMGIPLPLPSDDLVAFAYCLSALVVSTVVIQIAHSFGPAGRQRREARQRLRAANSVTIVRDRAA